MSITDPPSESALQIDGVPHSKQIDRFLHPLPVQQPNGLGQGPEVVSTAHKIETSCGPLLNYKRMSNTGTPSARWHGSVLIVTTPGQQDPTLILRPAQRSQQRPSAVQRPSSLSDDFVDAPDTEQPGPISPPQPQASFSQKPSQDTSFHGEKLYADPAVEFWRFNIDLPLAPTDGQWEYTIPRLDYPSGGSADHLATRTFHVPAYTDSMRIMFHSCNGFSVGTDEEAWSGCALWNDVLRKHEENPIHVMIGGGDQIYNDGIRVSGPLREWCDMRNPLDRQKYPFSEDLRARCDKYYLENYMKWYSTEPFATANGQIPQVNIWDDHDIIDGFGSYVDRFMKCAVFRGIGGVAHKYYMLFQHHVPPPASTFTTDAPQTTTREVDDRTDPVQLQATYVMTEKEVEPHYLVADQPGPYVQEHSRSIYCELGAHIALLGIDARTERTRHQINYDETYDYLFNHASKQIQATAGRIKHFILLLGIPIAYPRMQWLENILQSPLMGLVRFAHKRLGFAGGLFNNFDGNVDLMDDLDDHYTAHQHKKERKDLIIRLQRLAKEFNVRVTILGGDVHLAAHGRFYSNPGLGIPAEYDHRYMPNIISSAITNHPPPQAVANLLAKRNKIHHLDHETDETLLNLFDHDPGRIPGQEQHEENGQTIKAKSAASNHCTLPSRNYAIIALSNPVIEHANGAANGNANGRANGSVNGLSNGAADGAARSSVNGVVDGAATEESQLSAELDGKFDLAERQHHNLSRKAGNPRSAQHAGEDSCGTSHPASSGTVPTGLGGAWGLDVTYRVEINQHDHDGHTQGYGLTIPGLHVRDQEKTEGAMGRGLDKAKDAARDAGEKV